MADDKPIDAPVDEPEVVFEPSPKLVDAMNQRGSRVARARPKEEIPEPEEAAAAHQYDPKKAAYPGQPRIPEADEGGPTPPTLEEIEESAAAAASAGETLRDANLYHEAASIYVYGGDQPTLHSIVGQLNPGEEKDFRAERDPNVLRLLAEQAEALGLKKRA